MLRRNSAKKYEMNATIPRALPRGPNRRTHTAVKSTAMKPTSATQPNGDRSAANVTDPTAGKNSSSMVTTRLCCCRSSATDDCVATIVPSIATVDPLWQR